MKTKTVHLHLDPTTLLSILEATAKAQADPENVRCEVNPMFQHARLVRYDWFQPTTVEVEGGKLLYPSRPYLHCEIEVPEDTPDTNTLIKVRTPE